MIQSGFPLLIQIVAATAQTVAAVALSGVAIMMWRRSR